MAETRPRRLSKTLLLVLQECELESSARLDVVTVADPGSEHCLQFCGRRPLRIDSIVQNHVEQRLMNLNAAVVCNKAELAKAVHEKADAGPGCADHLRQGFLRDLRNQCFWFTWLAKLRQQQKNPRQTLFAGVEQMIDKVGLGSHAAA